MSVKIRDFWYEKTDTESQITDAQIHREILK
jgi:hypothetical protein